MTEGIVTIKAGREKSIQRQHPWIFSGAIENNKHTTPGELVTVVDHKGGFLARGYWNPRSQIQVRIMTWQDEPIDEAWWRRMLNRAFAGRALQMVHRSEEAWGFRLINAENDFIPGLVVDYYAGWVVLQALTLYIDRQKKMIANLLADILKPRGIYERSDVDVRGKEGLKAATGLLWGMDVPETVTIKEVGTTMLVDIRHGHKTGYYLDQAANRHLLNVLISADFDGQGICRVLNLFSYTGGFALHALAASGVHTVSVDSSGAALQLAAQAMQLNNYPNDEHAQTYELVEADCFDYLHDAVKRGEQFDMIICDPPKFAHNAQQVDKAARGYKDLNLNAFKLIKSGGYLMTFSCSGAISPDLFQKIIFGALADSGRQAQIIKHLGASDDHPIALTFPEGEYLKGLLLRVY